MPQKSRKPAPARVVEVRLTASRDAILALAEEIGAAMADMWLDGELDLDDEAAGVSTLTHQ